MWTCDGNKLLLQTSVPTFVFADLPLHLPSVRLLYLWSVSVDIFSLKYILPTGISTYAFVYVCMCVFVHCVFVYLCQWVCADIFSLKYIFPRGVSTSCKTNLSLSPRGKSMKRVFKARWKRRAELFLQNKLWSHTWGVKSGGRWIS